MDVDWLYKQLSDAEKRQRYNVIHGTACSCAKKPLASASSTSSSSSTAGNAPSRAHSIAPVKEEPLDRSTTESAESPVRSSASSFSLAKILKVTSSGSSSSGVNQGER